MYPHGTILALREPQSTDDYTYPYDRVKVLGESPVQRPTNPESPWAAADAFGVVIQPLTEFDATIDKPYGELEQLYEVEEWPTDEATGQPITPENHPNTLPTPEQVFARSAREDALPKREPLPSLQDDHKSPEQLLREANQPSRRAK